MDIWQEAYYNSVDKIHSLVKSGADVNNTARGSTALYAAAYKGHVKAVEALLQLGANGQLLCCFHCQTRALYADIM